MGQVLLNKNANSGNQTSQNQSGGGASASGGASAGAGGGNNRPVNKKKNAPPGSVTSNGQKINKNGLKLGPSGKVVSHSVRPSTRKKALDATRNKRGSNGNEIHRKDKFKDKRVDTHGHSVDRKGEKIDDKSHIFLPKRNQPPKNP